MSQEERYSLSTLLIGFLAAVLILTAACERIEPLETQDRPLSTSELPTTPQLNLAADPDGSSDFSQANTVRFKRLLPEQGLSQSTVTCILQDSRGFMWFGTEDGLNQYDGYSFTVFKHDPEVPTSLNDDHILTIYEDRSDTLWIGTQKGGLNQFDRTNQRFTNIPMSSVRSILEDKNGRLWIGAGDGLYIYDRQTKQLERQRYGSVNVIYQDHLGEIWIGLVNRGLERIKNNQDNPVVYRVKVGDPDTLSSDTVLSIQEDRQGAIWIGTSGEGLDRFDRSDERFEHFRKSSSDRYNSEAADVLLSNIIWSIKEDHLGNLWIGTEIGGLVLFNPESGSFTHFQNNPGDPFSLSSDIVRTIYEDKSGILWIGTANGGVNKLDQGKGFTHYRHIPNNPDSLSGNFVTSIYVDKSNLLWIGTLRGLDSLDRNNGAWRHYQNIPDDPSSLSDNLITMVYEDPSGNIWVGATNGLNRFDHRREGFTLFPINAPRSMTSDASGILWIGADEGLYRLDPHTEDIRLVRRGQVQVVFLDRQGMLWLGRPGNGLSQLNPDTAIFKHYRSNPNDPQELSDDNVTSIFEDNRGDLWIGTHGGLNHFKRSQRVFTYYREKDGLPSDTIVGILGDRQGNLWLGTNAGLSKFNPRSGTFRNYNVSDGLQSNEFNACAIHESREGEMFFGGANGFNSFNPEHIIDNPHVPPVIITSFQVFNNVVKKDLTDNQIIRLSYQENFISFDFASLDFTAPEKNQYAFKMEGLDKDWVYAGTRRHADYPNLREGDYIFRVKGTNNDGVWNDSGSTVRVIVSPPFWKTWWFEGILAVILLGGAIMVYQMRIRSTKAHIQEQARAVEEERNRLARELHDSVTQSLYGVTLYAEAASGQIAMGNPGRAAEHLDELQDTAQEALAEMRLLIHELRPSILEEQGLEAALQARLMTVESRAGLKVELECRLENRLPPDIEEGLYRIAQEAFNNTLKHAHAHNIVVYLHQEKRTVILEISDDGVGFDPEKAAQRGGIGIQTLKERVTRLQGRITLKSSPGQGTRLLVEVPL